MENKSQQDIEKRVKKDSFHLRLTLFLFVLLICGFLVGFAIWLQARHHLLGSW